MLAYSTDQFDNESILRETKRWHRHTLISDVVYETIKSKFKSTLYSPNLFIRIGLFIFTVISASAANGLLMTITGGFSSNSETSIGIRLLVHGLIMLFVLEFFIKEKQLYKSGIDDALLYMGLGTIISGIYLLILSTGSTFNETTFILIGSFITLPLLIAATIRYSDMLVAASAFGCVMNILFYLIGKTGDTSKYIMPFVIMAASAVIYLLVLKYRKQEKFRHWDSSLWIVEILSLVLFYLAGNYFVVRTLSEELFNMNLAEGEDIPMAFFFYAFTAIIPLLCIFMGLKNKNRVLFRTGLFLIAVSVLTFKYYFSLGHHEITLTIGGILMIVIAWLAINYLKIPKYGITYKEDKDEMLLGNFDSETLIIAQSFGGNHAQQGETNPQMGGGKFGGGGADGSF